VFGPHVTNVRGSTPIKRQGLYATDRPVLSLINAAPVVCAWFKWHLRVDPALACVQSKHARFSSKQRGKREWPAN
jgi:hypothetical protein